MQIELLANQLTMKLSDGFNKHAGTDIKYASIIFNDFEENYKTKYNLDDIYNFCLYDNYYGNILNKLINQVFIPYLEDLSIDFNDNSTYYNKMLSKLQIHDIMSIIFKIINNNNCNINQLDYYSNKPINNLIEISNNTKDLPLFLRNYLPSFMFILKHGKKAVIIQQNIIKNWYNIHMFKKRHAVKIIEKKYIEYMMNPYTEKGKQTVKKLSNNYYKLASCEKIDFDIIKFDSLTIAQD